MPAFAPQSAQMVPNQAQRSRPRFRGRLTRRLVRIVPEDDFLARIAAGGLCEIAEDHADFRGFQFDREIFLAGLAGDAVPACANFEAGAAMNDAEVRCFVACLGGIRDDGNRGIDPDGGENALERAVGLLRQGCDCGGHGSVSFGCSGPFPMAHEETADLLRSARPHFFKILFSAVSGGALLPACG